MAREHDDDETADAGRDAGPPDADDTDETAPAPPRRALDGRTLAVCALVALIAAILAGLLVARLTDDDEPTTGRTTLTEAETVPDVVLTGFDGTEISSTEYLGQPLVINFWASWCTPCIEEMPAFERVHQSLGDRVAFLGVNSRDEERRAAQMIETTGVTYALAKDTDGALARALEVTNLPVTVLVLPDGTIAQTFQRKVSAERLCEAINQVLLNQSLEECG